MLGLVLIAGAGVLTEGIGELIVGAGAAVGTVGATTGAGAGVAAIGVALGTAATGAGVALPPVPGIIAIMPSLIKFVSFDLFNLSDNLAILALILEEAFCICCSSIPCGGVACTGGC